MTFTVAVVGSRSISVKSNVVSAIERAPWFDAGADDLEIVTGGAKGVDSLAEQWATDRGIDTTIIQPNWNDWSNGHPAIERNTDIVEAADAIIAVWDGQSNGTRDSIDKALDRGKPLYVEIVE